jgi:hypothetical protein
MASLITNVRRTFADLITDDGFEVAIPFCDSRFVSMVRYVSPSLCAYLFVLDGRPGGANLTVDLWLAPPESPDHSIEALVAGYQIQILSQYDVDDDVITIAVTRVKKILPLCSQFDPIVCGNLKDATYNPTAREFYLTAKRIYEEFLEDSSSYKLVKEVRDVIESSCRSRKAFFASIESLSALLSESISELRTESDTVRRQALTESVLCMYYVHLLADRSLSRLAAR